MSRKKFNDSDFFNDKGDIEDKILSLCSKKYNKDDEKNNADDFVNREFRFINGKYNKNGDFNENKFEEAEIVESDSNFENNDEDVIDDETTDYNNDSKQTLAYENNVNEKESKYSFTNDVEEDSNLDDINEYKQTPKYEKIDSNFIDHSNFKDEDLKVNDYEDIEEQESGYGFINKEEETIRNVNVNYIDNDEKEIDSNLTDNIENKNDVEESKFNVIFNKFRKNKEKKKLNLNNNKKSKFEDFSNKFKRNKKENSLVDIKESKFETFIQKFKIKKNKNENFNEEKTNDFNMNSLCWILYLFMFIIIIYIFIAYFKNNKNDYFLSKGEIIVETINSLDNDSSTIKISTSENADESKNYEYSIDGGMTWKKDSEFVVFSNGIYDVVIRNGDELSETVKVKIENLETHNPSLKLNFDKDVYVGDYVDVKSYVSKINKLSDDSITIIVEPEILDTTTPGDKNVTCTLEDKNGNKTKMDFVITVKENNESKENKGDTITQYRFRTKIDHSYVCGSYDCGYYEETNYEEVNKSTGKCDESFNTSPLKFTDTCIYIPGDNQASCEKKEVVTNRYVRDGDNVIDIIALNKKGTQSSNTRKYFDSLKKGISDEYSSIKEWYDDTYSAAPCGKDEIDIFGYCHAICEYFERRCPSGYDMIDGQCKHYISKSCDKMCTSSEWSEWSEWSTTKVIKSSTVDVETKTIKR